MAAIEIPVSRSALSTRTRLWPAATVALLFGLFHLLTNGQYGFHRDEWQFLSDARHLDWGFVPYPPFTAAVEHLSLGLFGLSMMGLRLGSVIAQSLVVFLSGLMARDLGGNRLAQSFAAIAVALSPLPMFESTEFQYSSFDLLWWVLLAWCVIRLLRDEQPRWWLAIGAVIGLALETKYAICFELAGVVAGVLFTDARRFLRGPWLWLGALLSLLMFAPNLWWLIGHDFISYHFLQGIHARDVGEGRADGFVRDQFLRNANLAAAPVWLIGLYGYIRQRRYRMLAWMYAVPLLLFLIAQGRYYYVCGAYPMLLAMGSVLCANWLGTLRPLWRNGIAAAMFAAVLAVGTYATLCVVPLASSGPLRDFALSRNGDLREELGWNEILAQVVAIRDSLPPAQQRDLGIVVGNYGEYGSLALMGPRYHLPTPVSAVNSAWLRGYPTSLPNHFIVLGSSAQRASELFDDCRLAGHTYNALHMRNEESGEHPDIFLCGRLRISLSELWKHGPEFD